MSPSMNLPVSLSCLLCISVYELTCPHYFACLLFFLCALFMTCCASCRRLCVAVSRVSVSASVSVSLSMCLSSATVSLILCLCPLFCFCLCLPACLFPRLFVPPCLCFCACLNLDMSPLLVSISLCGLCTVTTLLDDCVFVNFLLFLVVG